MRTKRQTHLIALIVGLGGILYGYDIGVIAGALPFIQKAIPLTHWQLGFIVGAVLGGGLVGSLIAGPLADWLGRRMIIALSAALFLIGILCITVAHSYHSLLYARLLLGIAIGVVAVAVPLYVSEIAPPAARGKQVTYFQMYLTFGIVLAYAIDLLLTPSGNWHGMFLVVLIPASILMIACFSLPESPRWLVARQELQKAINTLLALREPKQAQKELIEIESSLYDNRTTSTWRQLLNRKNLAPLLIALAVVILNQLTGINTFLQYAPQMFHHGGMQTHTGAMTASLIIGVINFMGTLIAIFLVDLIGRRPLLIVGVCGVCLSECFMAIAQPWFQSFAWLQALGLAAFILSFAIGPGVIVWLVISELLPTRIRSRGMALCLFFSSLSGTLIASVFPVLLSQLKLSGVYTLCAIFSGIYVLLSVYAVPETRSKSLEDIQTHFEDHTTQTVKSTT